MIEAIPASNDVNLPGLATTETLTRHVNLNYFSEAVSWEGEERLADADSWRITGYTEIDKNIDAWDMGPLGEPMAASRLGAGRLLFPIGWRENFGYKSLQRCGSGVPWGAWLERL